METLPEPLCVTLAAGNFVCSVPAFLRMYLRTNGLSGAIAWSVPGLGGEFKLLFFRRRTCLAAGAVAIACFMACAADAGRLILGRVSNLCRSLIFKLAVTSSLISSNWAKTNDSGPSNVISFVTELYLIIAMRLYLCCPLYFEYRGLVVMITCGYRISIKYTYIVLPVKEEISDTMKCRGDFHHERHFSFPWYSSARHTSLIKYS